eukprot:scaffold57_cov254-Pinguiococcus_pyrenoidosus.AAC.10
MADAEGPDDDDAMTVASLVFDDVEPEEDAMMGDRKSSVLSSNGRVSDDFLEDLHEMQNWGVQRRTSLGMPPPRLLGQASSRRISALMGVVREKGANHGNDEDEEDGDDDDDEYSTGFDYEGEDDADDEEKRKDAADRGKADRAATKASHGAVERFTLGKVADDAGEDVADTAYADDWDEEKEETEEKGKSDGHADEGQGGIRASASSKWATPPGAGSSGPENAGKFSRQHSKDSAASSLPEILAPTLKGVQSEEPGRGAHGEETYTADWEDVDTDTSTKEQRSSTRNPPHQRALSASWAAPTREMSQTVNRRPLFRRAESLNVAASEEEPSGPSPALRSWVSEDHQEKRPQYSDERPPRPLTLSKRVSTAATVGSESGRETPSQATFAGSKKVDVLRSFLPATACQCHSLRSEATVNDRMEAISSFIRRQLQEYRDNEGNAAYRESREKLKATWLAAHARATSTPLTPATYVYSPQTGRRVPVSEEEDRKRQAQKALADREKERNAQKIPPAVGYPNTRIKRSVEDWLNRKFERGAFAPKRKGKSRHFEYREIPEQRRAAIGDVLLMIEHCHSCWKHSRTLRHDATTFQSYCADVEAAVAARLQLGRPIRLLAMRIAADLENSHSRRLGAFEVQVFVKGASYVEKRVLHSKLATSKWPDPKAISRRVAKLLRIVTEKDQESSESNFLKMQESVQRAKYGGKATHETLVQRREEWVALRNAEGTVANIAQDVESCYAAVETPDKEIDWEGGRRCLSGINRGGIFAELSWLGNDAKLGDIRVLVDTRRDVVELDVDVIRRLGSAITAANGRWDDVVANSFSKWREKVKFVVETKRLSSSNIDIGALHSQFCDRTAKPSATPRTKCLGLTKEDLQKVRDQILLEKSKLSRKPTSKSAKSLLRRKHPDEESNPFAKAADELSSELRAIIHSIGESRLQSFFNKHRSTAAHEHGLHPTVHYDRLQQALRECGVDLSAQVYKCIFYALDTNGDNAVDIEDVHAFAFEVFDRDSHSTCDYAADTWTFVGEPHEMRSCWPLGPDPPSPCSPLRWRGRGAVPTPDVDQVRSRSRSRHGAGGVLTELSSFQWVSSHEVGCGRAGTIAARLSDRSRGRSCGRRLWTQGTSRAANCAHTEDVRSLILLYSQRTSQINLWAS